MKKLIYILLAGVLAVSIVACSSNEQPTDSSSEPEEVVSTDEEFAPDGSITEDDFIGTWACGRATITIDGTTESPDGVNEFTVVHIHWGSSAFEATTWDYYTLFDGQSLVDDGRGIKQNLVFNEEDENSPEITVVDQDLAAKFEFTEDGKLVWTDFRDDAGADMEFEYIEMAEPEAESAAE